MRNETVTGVPAAMEIVPGVNAKFFASISTSPPAVGLGEAEPDRTRRRAAQRAKVPDRTWRTSDLAAFIFATAVRPSVAARESFPAEVEREAGSVAATAPGFAHVPARTVTATSADFGSDTSRSVAVPAPLVRAATVADPLAPPAPTVAFHEVSTTAAALGETAARSRAAAARSAAAAAGARPSRSDVDR